MTCKMGTDLCLEFVLELLEGLGVLLFHLLPEFGHVIFADAISGDSVQPQVDFGQFFLEGLQAVVQSGHGGYNGSNLFLEALVDVADALDLGL